MLRTKHNLVTVLLIVALMLGGMGVYLIFDSDASQPTAGGPSAPYKREHNGHTHLDPERPARESTALPAVESSSGNVPQTTGDTLGSTNEPKASIHEPSNTNQGSDVGRSFGEGSDTESSHLIRTPSIEQITNYASKYAPLPYGKALPNYKYHEIMRGEEVNPLAKGRAARRVQLGFNDWPGRDSGWLGGFRFRVDDHPVFDLYEYKVLEDDVSTYASDGFCWGVSRQIRLSNSKYKVGIYLHVSMKAGWTHEALLSDTMGYSTGIGTGDNRRCFTGAEIGKPVGDVSLWWKPSFEHPRKIHFSRNNVEVMLTVSAKKPNDIRDFELDLYTLALEMDRKIVNNARSAESFENLQPHCPQFKEFRLELGVGDEWHARVHVDVEPAVGDKVFYKFESRDSTLGYGRHDGKRIQYIPNRPVDDPATEAAVRPRTEEREHTAWVVAIGEDLLWTVAEASFHAPEAPEMYK